MNPPTIIVPPILPIIKAEVVIVFGSEKATPKKVNK